MNFNPDHAPETADLPLLDEGDHTLVVLDAEETVSNSGNDMIRLRLGKATQPACEPIRDFLVATEAALWKVRQFATAAGLSDKFDSGTLTEDDCIGRYVKARIVHESDPGFDPQAKVAKYLPMPAGGLGGTMEPDRLAATRKAHGIGAGSRSKPDAATASEQAASKYAHPDVTSGAVPADGIPF
jgi:hypothetical protein